MVHFRAVHFWVIHRMMHPWALILKLMILSWNQDFKSVFFFQIWGLSDLIEREQSLFLILGKFFIETLITCTIKVITQQKGYFVFYISYFNSIYCRLKRLAEPEVFGFLLWSRARRASIFGKQPKNSRLNIIFTEKDKNSGDRSPLSTVWLRICGSQFFFQRSKW